MLIETPYKIGDTVSLKLSSGEEIVARLDAESDTTYTLIKPLMLTMSQQGIGLAPYMFTVRPDAKININAKNVICIVKTEESMSKQYISNTTGIAL
jgi:CxxC motif-containing protein